MNESAHSLIQMISEDNLRGTLELLLEYCGEQKIPSSHEMEIRSIIGRLTRIENDRRQGVIPLAQFYENLNQIRVNTLSLVKSMESPNHLDLVQASKEISPVLEQEIEKSSQLLSQYNRLDLAYKVLLILVTIAGVGILLFSLSSNKEPFERVYLGSVSMMGIFSSMYFYNRIRGIEVMNYGKVKSSSI